VLFFEYLLDEFHDSHLILNTNRDSSFRLFAPVYATIDNGKPIIVNVWQTQLDTLDQNLIGAEILKINGVDIIDAIQEFPTHCNDKNAEPVREWITNKILAGRYDQPRVLTLQLRNNQIIDLDLDKLKIKTSSELLTSSMNDDIGMIKINNSLGDNGLIEEFDKALNDLSDTKGLVIDLRNTVDGGNSYVARGIMGRFISEPEPYQKHWLPEQIEGYPIVARSWLEYVEPRLVQYKKPVVVLVGRWTGSMGEGLAVGFEGMGRGTVVGTEMERLAGEMDGFSFKNQRFGYRLSTAKLFHVNGTPREKYRPTVYVVQTTTAKDETLEKGLELIKRQAE
jgi:C-terminal processing protease CtpA/Prc